MYDARHPDFSAHAGTSPPLLPGLAPIRISPDLFAKVGESFAASLSSLQRTLAALDVAAPDLNARLDTVAHEVARLEQFGVQIQQLARLLSSKAPLVRERIDLAATARSALAEWHRVARAGQAATSGSSAAAGPEVNAAAMAQLLDLGIEYVLHEGAAIEVDVSPQGPAAPAMLTIRARRAQPADGLAAESDEVHWLLFVQLARAIGLTPRRLPAGDTLSLTLTFPEAGDRPGGDAPPSPALPHTASAAGRRVLLIEPHDFVRVQAYRLLREVGVMVDASVSIEQARKGRRGTAPDAVITGIPASDPGCAAWLDELRAEQPRLRVIELVDDDDAFALSDPGSDSPGRIGRHDLERTLTQALAQELDAAWPAA